VTIRLSEALFVLSAGAARLPVSGAVKPKRVNARE